MRLSHFHPLRRVPNTVTRPSMDASRPEENFTRSCLVPDTSRPYSYVGLAVIKGDTVDCFEQLVILNTVPPAHHLMPKKSTSYGPIQSRNIRKLPPHNEDTLYGEMDRPVENQSIHC